MDISLPRVSRMDCFDKIGQPDGSFNDRLLSYTTTWTDTRVGQPNPIWEQQVLRHQNATTPMSASRHEVVISPGSVTQKYVPKGTFITCGGGHYNTYRGFSAIDTVAQATAQSLAVSRMLHNARQMQTGFHTGAFLGELRETIHGIARPLDALTRYLNKGARNWRRDVYKFKERWHRNKVRIFRNQRTRDQYDRDLLHLVSGTWLELNFGIAPLISDINGALTTLYRPMHIYKRVSGRASITTGNSAAPVEVAGGSCRLLVGRTDRVVYEAIARGEVGFAREASSRVNDDWGLTASNFVPDLYQVIPYTWLIDYFTNLGDIVEAAFSGSVPLAWSNVTVRSRGVGDVTWSYLPYNANFLLAGQTSGRTRYLSKFVNRSSEIGDGIPPLQFKLPNSLGRLCNLAALAAVKFVDPGL